MKPKHLLPLFLLLLASTLHADEGMWIPSNINKQTYKVMKDLGLKMKPKQIYNTDKPSLTDAVVSFGGFCSGVVVSEDGLVFTNHHCGFSCVQQHSTVEHNYLKDGFVAQTLEEELPNPELYVRFLIAQLDVSEQILSAIKPTMTETERANMVDSISMKMCEEIHFSDTTLVAVVEPYYRGNEYILSVYRDYNDVRLVFAPPSSVGKFGWDTDNWMWPRHTGDFSVFRIYANNDNEPADYSPNNVPLKAPYFAPISLDGYKEGSFCMTLGYPGTTERYLSSYGIEEMMNTTNMAQIDIRGVKQDIWKQGMNRSEDIRIKYASKYDESSNYWKNSIGTNKAIKKLHILQKKREMEQELRRWIAQNDNEREHLLQLFNNLELAYKSRKEAYLAQAYLFEAFLYAPEILQIGISLLNLDFDGEEKQVVSSLKKIVEQYDNLDIEIDKEVFIAMLREYRSKVDAKYLPQFYKEIDEDLDGKERVLADWLYLQSELKDINGLSMHLKQDTTYNINQDPAIKISIDVLVAYFDMEAEMQQASLDIEKGERELNAAMRRMKAAKRAESRKHNSNHSWHGLYPDANSTMRLSFGTVAGYSPSDGAEYAHFTTTKGILEKVKAHAGDADFEVEPHILSLLSSGNFGRYGNDNGEMNVCFISNNDITGGNSGSAMFNGKGELLGLAFDGNWEAMSSDLMYEPKRQRCIGVDVRYILFMIEKYGKASRLIEELNIAK